MGDFEVKAVTSPVTSLAGAVTIRKSQVGGNAGFVIRNAINELGVMTARKQGDKNQSTRKRRPHAGSEQAINQASLEAAFGAVSVGI